METTTILCARYSPPLNKARRKIGSTPYCHNLSEVSTNFLWFLPKNIHPIARSKRSPTICSTSRRTPKESFHVYVKKFKVEKARMVGASGGRRNDKSLRGIGLTRVYAFLYRLS